MLAMHQRQFSNVNQVQNMMNKNMTAGASLNLNKKVKRIVKVQPNNNHSLGSSNLLSAHLI